MNVCVPESRPEQFLLSLGLHQLEQNQQTRINPRISYGGRDELGNTDLLAWLGSPQANLAKKLSFKCSLAQRLGKAA